MVLIMMVLFNSCTQHEKGTQSPSWLVESVKKLEVELLKRYGDDVVPRINRGLKQIAGYWRVEDGNSDVFEDFVRNNFVADNQGLDQMFDRFQIHLEKINGHMDRLILDFREQADLDRGPLMPFDEIFAAYSPGAHITDDFFKNKLAFIVLLNFPLTSLEERSTDGMRWTRKQWAETRLAANFNKRVPADVSLEISKISSESERYIAQYNIWMHHLIDDDGKRMFPPKLRLLSHWNLRDELKSQYAKENEGYVRQKIIQKVMERIIDQTIPEAVIDNPALDWNPISNKVMVSSVMDYNQLSVDNKDVSGHPEPNTRYQMLKNNFIVQKSADPYWPATPNFIDRRFDLGREIPEERVKKMFDKLLTSPVFAQIANLIKKRLGRDLEPFDIWYNGFRSQSNYTEEMLNKIVAKKYPDPAAFEKDIPRMLTKLGFSPERIDEISRLITVDPARGSGHAWGGQMRGAKAHLRTRIGSNGMDYKGYNIAVHELGHNVEQVISMNNIDYTLLQGVPNTAFTEAMAFVFQARDLDLLGLSKSGTENESMKILHDFWASCEIASVALVDIAVWHWMYDHPQASADQLRDATISIAKEIWNRYYAPVFNLKDVTILGIYSHMISYPLYLADYPLGHLIAYQIEEQIRKVGNVGTEFDRIVRIGNVAPDLWMLQATGSKVGPKAIIGATEKVLKQLN